MPQVVRVSKFLVLIYTEDHPPAHVHVKFDNCVVRVLISSTTVTLDKKLGRPKAADVRRALQVVADNLEACLAKWEEIYP